MIERIRELVRLFVLKSSHCRSCGGYGIVERFNESGDIVVTICGMCRGYGRH